MEKSTISLLERLIEVFWEEGDARRVVLEHLDECLCGKLKGWPVEYDKFDPGVVKELRIKTLLEFSIGRKCEYILSYLKKYGGENYESILRSIAVRAGLPPLENLECLLQRLEEEKRRMEMRGKARAPRAYHPIPEGDEIIGIKEEGIKYEERRKREKPKLIEEVGEEKGEVPMAVRLGRMRRMGLSTMDCLEEWAKFAQNKEAVDEYISSKPWICHKKIVEEKGKPRAGEIAVDIGCGPRSHYALLAEGGAYVIGIDGELSGEFAKRNKKEFPHFDFIVADMHCLPLRKGCADKVLMANVFFYSNPVGKQLVALEIDRVLKEGGEVMFINPAGRMRDHVEAACYLRDLGHEIVENCALRLEWRSRRSCKHYFLRTKKGGRDWEVDGELIRTLAQIEDELLRRKPYLPRLREAIRNPGLLKRIDEIKGRDALQFYKLARDVRKNPLLIALPYLAREGREVLMECLKGAGVREMRELGEIGTEVLIKWPKYSVAEPMLLTSGDRALVMVGDEMIIFRSPEMYERYRKLIDPIITAYANKVSQLIEERTYQELPVKILRK